MKLKGARPVEAFSLVWIEDEKRLGAKIGDPASQALWESCVMLRCLWVWALPHEQGYIRARGDAHGVLAAFAKRSAASPSA